MNRRLIAHADRLLAAERGIIRKTPGGRISVCLVYPNRYSVGMASLGFQGIYALLNSRDDVVCERAFLPDEKQLAEYRRTRTPVFSLESKRPLAGFDMVAFSLSFENDYPNLFRILELSRIPFWAAERTARHPLLMAGGVCATINPEPFAEVFDLVFAGDAETSLPAFIDAYAGTHRSSVVAEAVKIPGIHAPGYARITYHPDGTIASRSVQEGTPDGVVRQRCGDIGTSPVTTAIVSSEIEFADMYLVEAMRGCPWNCRFCMVGNVYRPVRPKPLDAVRAEIGRARALTQRIGLVGPSLTDYRHIEDVLALPGVMFSLTSLRATERSARLIDLLKGAKSVSIAPEAGTERMRRVINKKVTEQDIIETAALLFQNGIDQLRLYFMIGLPGERDEDIAGIVQLIARIRALSPRGMITAGISTFVPKPFTPFQWAAMEEQGSIREKLRRIKKDTRKLPGVRIMHDVLKQSYLQGLLSRGDRRLGQLLAEMVLSNDYASAAERTGVSIPWYVHRQRGQRELLPWDFIDAGVAKEHLWNEWQESQRLF
ncbi:MAG: radical SAM protein [Nitrospiraceae bacterium]|jgi:radical SAM superfamily enzyme YgiQ (UPF0313 family)|nr:radical SAM protein [Nitrospiraceae bacterium]